MWGWWSMILESDKHTGVVRKHYIGMVTMLDILSHIAGDKPDGGDEGLDMERGWRFRFRRLSVIVLRVLAFGRLTLAPGKF
ncbi:hypothetical protein HanPSC8_Chr13g0551911 [Helianthus annuus]|nr:hypothetical protein HanPSC8_Chr13g0551911 [Helianthus annuus]